jgi:glyoxylase I family protein
LAYAHRKGRKIGDKLAWIHLKDLPARVVELKNQGVRFRNEMEAGPGGKQIQVKDPDGNPIELFEPASR